MWCHAACHPCHVEGSMLDLSATTPKMDLAIQDMEPRGEEWRASHAIDSPLFQRIFPPNPKR
jgi:hypothetical protein